LNGTENQAQVPLPSFESRPIFPRMSSTSCQVRQYDSIFDINVIPHVFTDR
jgi:hypothetical protein